MFPPILKEFSVLMSPESLKAFNKMELVKKAFKVIRGNVDTLDENLQKELSRGLRNTPRGRALYSLRVYFAQLYLPEAISLDLRSTRFFYEDGWHFKGEQFAYKINPKVRKALVGTYESYYTGNPEDIKKHLVPLGLVNPKWSNDKKEMIYQMFIGHFQLAGQSSHEFLMEELVASLKKIFLFIREQKSKVPSEFAVLGLYLVSLYMNIEETGEKLDVKAAFLKAQSSAKSYLDEVV